MTDHGTGIVLLKGAHAKREQGMCALEFAAYLAGEQHSDRPQCVCPVIGDFVRRWSDDLGKENRNRILPGRIRGLIATKTRSRLNGKGDFENEIEDERSRAAFRWLALVAQPAWMDLIPDLEDHAAAVRSMSETSPEEDVVAVSTSAWSKAIRVQNDAWMQASLDTPRGMGLNALREKARRDTFLAPSVDITLAAMRSTARNAAWGAGGTVRGYAAHETSWVSARLAAWRATRKFTWRPGETMWSAAADALHPTVEHLQQSALELLDRMIAIGRR